MGKRTRGSAVFTGLIEAIGAVQSVVAQRGGSVLRIRPDVLDLSQVRDGDSIAVNGACLTVVKHTGDAFEADASPETLDKTTLGGLRPGDRVHLERALALGGRLDGHLVQGHVDCTGTVETVETSGNAWTFRVTLPAEHSPMVVAKGSIAIDGTSLTVNGCGAGWFEVAIIPHTAAKTLLVDRKRGDRVNIETDILGKYVVSALRSAGMAPGESAAPSGASSMTEEWLRSQGFGK